MAADETQFAPRATGPTALFLDTSGLFPYFHPEVREHEVAQSFLQAIGRGEHPYRPLYTSTYVIDELVTLLQSKGRSRWAIDAYTLLTESENFTVVGETEERFRAAGERLQEYDDHALSFTDAFCSVVMDEHDVDHVFAYDGDYEALGYEVVP